MRKALVIIPNLFIIGLVLIFIISYANFRAEQSKMIVIEDYEKMTVTVNQIITNYLEDEQHLCDIWSNYVNSYANAGTPMTADEAISYIRRVKISPEITGHLIFADDPEYSGFSTAANIADPEDFTVSYKNISVFDNLDDISSSDGVVNLTRAYTNPDNGVQSIAFMNYVSIIDPDTGELRKGLLMRVIPLSILEEKLVFLKGEYDSVEISLVDKEGNYVIHGKSLKNSNFFEYFRYYNHVSIEEFEAIKNEITGGVGSMVIKNSKGDDCLLSYTPLDSLKSWYLLAYIPMRDLEQNSVVDWLLPGIVSFGLVFLLVYNFIILMTYNRKLSEAASQANQANEAKSYFLSTMSHDIRTPMNAILGLNEMILRDSDDEKILGYSENIKTAGKTLLGLINDILDFSKIEAGKMDIINVDYSFVSVLNDLVNMVQRKAEDKGLSFNIDIDSNIPSILNGDEIRIKQIIINILSNAVKYTKEGSITFSAGCEKIPDKPDRIILKIKVADTGIGIKPEDMGKLFKAFERIEEKRNRSIEGTGLGMTITQSFLSMMGTHLQAESVYGEGSVFSFDLEQKVIKWDPIGNYEDAFRRSIKERRVYREKFTAPDAEILVVDDTPVNLTVFKSLLERTKINIDTAGSGDEAISLFKSKKYDMIFLDHMMPDKDGIETLAEMKGIKDSPNNATPIVCLTANAISGMREMYMKAGFDDYITKPIDPDRLETMILAYLPKEMISSADMTENTDDTDIPEFLGSIPDLDVESGVRHCGSKHSYMITLKAYLDNAFDNADAIESSWKDKDLKKTTILVHALKSTSRVIGALKLGDLAEELEKAGDSKDLQKLEKDIPVLLEKYRNLASLLVPLYSDDKKETEDVSKPLISDDKLNEAYEALLEFCEAFDFDSVSHIIESLRVYSIPEKERARYDSLVKAVDNYDYDLIPGIIDRGKKQ